MKANRVCWMAFIGAAVVWHFTAMAATLTFEKFSPGMDHFPIPSGYGGLQWKNFEVLNGQNQTFRTGYRVGIISPNNVIFNALGDPARIECDRTFSFESGHFTAAVIDGLNVSVKGYAAGQLLYSQTLSLNTAESLFMEFNWQGVDRVEFETQGSQIAIDDLTVEVPGAAPENEPVNAPASVPAIDLGRIVVNSIGQFTFTLPTLPGAPGPAPTPNYYMIDQAHYSNGGVVLPNVDVNWDTNTAFTVTFAAPAGKKFLVTTPPNSMAQFGAFLWWETGDRGGFSGSGPVVVTFENLEGDAPNFYESDAVLSSSHGFFGIVDLESTPIVSDLAFTAMTIRGTVSPQVTGSGLQTFVPHNECSLLVHDLAGGATLTLVPVTDPQALAASSQPKVSISRNSNAEPVLYFKGVLQSSASVSGPFEDVPGNPQSGYKIPAGSAQFYRVRN